MAMGVKSFKKAYCNNFGAAHSPDPAGKFCTGVSANN